MLLDFKELNDYLEVSKKLQSNSDMATFADQKVPQNGAMTGQGDIFQTQISPMAIPQLPLTVTEFMDISELAPMPPQSQNSVTRVTELNNVSNVTDLTSNINQTYFNTPHSPSDQRLYTSSPKVLVDLDNVNEQEVSLYNDQNIPIKEENLYVDCNNGHTTQNYSYPIYDYSLIDTEDVKMFSSPDFTHIKLEHSEPDFTESFEHTIVLALKKEIHEVCKTLGILPEPTSWSKEDAGKWILWHTEDYNVMDQFLMTGSELCRLSADDFQLRSPDSGKNLHAQLDVWKNACKLSGPTFQQTTETRDTYQAYNADESWGSPSLSPTPSVVSDDSTGSAVMSPTLDEERHHSFSCIPQSRNRIEAHHKQTIHLWEFLKELLLQPENYSTCIKWLDRERGVFRIEDSSRVARLWGRRKNRPAMNYDKLSRSIRQYYKKNIIKKTENSKRLVYQFCSPYL